MYNFLCQNVLIYYLQKELKTFSFREILVMHRILEQVVLNISKYIFCAIILYNCIVYNCVKYIIVQKSEKQKL